MSRGAWSGPESVGVFSVGQLVPEIWTHVFLCIISLCTNALIPHWQLWRHFGDLNHDECYGVIRRYGVSNEQMVVRLTKQIGSGQSGQFFIRLDRGAWSGSESIGFSFVGQLVPEIWTHVFRCVMSLCTNALLSHWRSLRVKDQDLRTLVHLLQ